MYEDTRLERHDGPSTDRTDFDRYTSYDDEGSLVICDRTNPSAWIRSDETESLSQ